MPRGIFIADKEYTFQASIQLLAHVFSSFVDKNEEKTFSVEELCAEQIVFLEQ